ncbi:MAG: hypothetical protein SGJ18_00095 [Pseudomonadota bacterium]|nr:hypothetical protein [Pseudomonadota bacterium]
MRNILLLILLAEPIPTLANPANPYYFEDSGEVREIICGPTPSFEKICKKSKRECYLKKGSEFCQEENIDKARLRLNSEELRVQYFTKLFLKFQEMISDSENIRFCGKGFAETKLQILSGLPAITKTAYYQLGDNSIGISEGMILNAYTFEDIELTLYHELGHSCQFNRNNLLRYNDTCELNDDAEKINQKIQIAARDSVELETSTTQRCIENYLDYEIGQKKNWLSAFIHY